MALAAVAAVIIGAVVFYNYSAEQTRQRGFEFGNELLQLQEEVMQLQADFNSKITQWSEGDLMTQDLLEYAELHLENLGMAVKSYADLDPPSQFLASVDLFQLSTDSQLESDRYYVEWIKTGKDSNRIKSDSLLQESFDFEMLALGEFNRAKLGYTEYEDGPEKFEAPDVDIANKVSKIWENMKEKCHLEGSSQQDIDSCIDQAKSWKAQHMP